MPPHPRLPSSSLSLPYPPRAPLEASPARSLRTVSDFRHQLARQVGTESAEQEERRDQMKGFQQLWDRFLIQSNLGESSSDWRLALPTMASSLTLHLLEGTYLSLLLTLGMPLTLYAVQPRWIHAVITSLLFIFWIRISPTTSRTSIT